MRRQGIILSTALEGIRVVEFSHVISGPFCGQLLGDMGAEVIKVERPEKGEFYRQEGRKNEDGISVIFPTYNRNKKDITLNVQDPRSLELFHELIKKCDIMIENYRPGLLKKLGFGYEDLKKINPKLIMVSISGFGQDGPDAKKLAYDMTIAACSGIMSVTGEPGFPMKAGISIADFTSGMYGAMSAIAALRHRELTGEGQYIDVSMMESSMSFMDAYFGETYFLQHDPVPVGNSRPTYSPVGCFKTKDGNILISCTKEDHWEQFARRSGHEELIGKPGWESGIIRKNRDPEVLQLAQDWAAQYTNDEAAELLEAAGIPNAPVLTCTKIMEHPQVKHRNSIMFQDYPGVGKYASVAFVPKFSTMDTPQKRAPLLGEHNKEIYGDLLGFSDEKLQEYKDAKVI